MLDEACRAGLVLTANRQVGMEEFPDLPLAPARSSWRCDPNLPPVDTSSTASCLVMNPAAAWSVVQVCWSNKSRSSARRDSPLARLRTLLAVRWVDGANEECLFEVAIRTRDAGSDCDCDQGVECVARNRALQTLTGASMGAARNHAEQAAGDPNSTPWCIPDLVYACTNLGQLFRSDDVGNSWRQLKRQFGEIRSMILRPLNN